VLADVRAGLVSMRSALEDYGAVVREVGDELVVDQRATEDRRSIAVTGAA
jgi:hypothetical protein